MPSQSKYENRKVSRNHLSALMRFILLNADGGIQRSEITERFYSLERRYCGFYADPCLRGKQKSRYESRYRRAQTSISKALRRLEKRGLVRLVRRDKYAKKIYLTEKGATVSNALDKSDRLKTTNDTQEQRPAAPAKSTGPWTCRVGIATVLLYCGSSPQIVKC